MPNTDETQSKQLAVDCGAVLESHLHHRMAKNASNHITDLIAYVRVGTSGSRISQVAQLEDFCRTHGYRLAQIFEDVGQSTAGLNKALGSMGEADGLITADIANFIRNPNDKLKDLRPLLYHFFSQSNKCFDPNNKRLIVVNEGIDTGCVAGQFQAVDHFCHSI